MNPELSEEGGITVRDHVLKVPYRSQRLDVLAGNQNERACGMVCTWMALEFYGAQPPELDHMIALAAERGGLIPGVGWDHRFLVRTFQNYGLRCERYDKSDPPYPPEEMPAILASIIEGGDPVLASVLQPSGGGHIVLLTGTRRNRDGELEGFFLHDSDASEVWMGQNVFWPLTTFMERWRRLAILPEKPADWSPDMIDSKYPT